MSPDILLTPPLLARRLIAGFVIPWMLSLNTCNQMHIMRIQKIKKIPSLPFCVSLLPPCQGLCPPCPSRDRACLSLFLLVRSEFRLFPIRLILGHVRFPLVCFGTRDCHYAITLGQRKSKKWKCFNQWERSGGETTNGRRLSVCGTIQLPGIRYACLNRSIKVG